jgi:iron complex outermembrane receptor protein
VFFNQIGDMQREVNLADPISGVVQIIKNTADAEIWGLELDGAFPLGESTVLLASLGYIDPQYTKVIFDLNGGCHQRGGRGPVPAARCRVDLQHWPGQRHPDRRVISASRVNYAYRDDAFYRQQPRIC